MHYVYFENLVSSPPFTHANTAGRYGVSMHADRIALMLDTEAPAHSQHLRGTTEQLMS